MGSRWSGSRSRTSRTPTAPAHADRGLAAARARRRARPRERPLRLGRDHARRPRRPRPGRRHAAAPGLTDPPTRGRRARESALSSNEEDDMLRARGDASRGSTRPTSTATSRTSGRWCGWTERPEGMSEETFSTLRSGVKRVMSARRPRRGHAASISSFTDTAEDAQRVHRGARLDEPAATAPGGGRASRPSSCSWTSRLG